jgi:ABC-type sugar transport system permease subunit
MGQFINRNITWFLLMPSFVFYTLFSTLPMLMAIGIGFTEWSGIGINTIKWIGIGNYIELFSDRFFWTSLRNNVIIVGGSVFIQCTIALVLAVILDSGLRFSEIFRTVFFMPTVLSFIVVGLLFSLLLSPTVGIINPALVKLGLANLQHQWLGDKGTALYTVMVVNIWKEFGFSMFLFLAGLQTISRELYEAARIDGAGPWKSLWFITIPLLREVTIVVIILAVNQAFLVFDLIYVMTSGGPYHASDVLATYMYNRAFTGGRMGYGTAIAEVLFVVVFLVTLLQLRITKAGSTEY